MTLVEVLVSLLILGVVIVGLGQGLTLGIRMNTETKSKISSLSICKRVIERLKSQIQVSQAAFDTANTNTSFNATYYVDDDGNTLSPSQDPSARAFQVITTVGDWTDAGGNALSATDSNGASHVLVKFLTVKVVAQGSALSTANTGGTGSPRETALAVEMVRPAA